MSTYPVIIPILMSTSHPDNVTGRADSDTGASQAAERLSAYLETAGASLSRNTVRALSADLRRFAAWCAERGLCPLPARGSTVAAYIEALEDARAPSTVRRYVSSIAAAHKASGERSPSEHAEVQRGAPRDAPAAGEAGRRRSRA